MLLKRNGLYKNRMKQGIRDAPEGWLLCLVAFLPSRRIVHDRDIEIFGLEWQHVTVLLGNILVRITLERCLAKVETANE